MNINRDLPIDLSDFLLKLYRMSHELPIESFQDAALALTRKVIPFDSSMWGTATTTKAGIEIHSIHLHETSTEMLMEYETLKHHDKAAATVVGLPHVTRCFNSDEWFGARDQREIRDYLTRYRHENVLITADTNLRNHFVHWISLFRGDKQAVGTEKERRLLGRLAPHIMQALGMNRLGHLTKLNVGDKALSPHGSAISDVRGVIHHADPLFRSLLQNEWSDWDGRLLPAQLLESMPEVHEQFVGETFVARWHYEHGLLFIWARPRCRADSLTNREKEVALQIAKGKTYKEIALMLGRSPATIRNHIQSIYEKLEVSNIAQLIHELRATY